MKQILNICVGQNVPRAKICSRVPSMVDRSAVFVIDLSADECGIYGCHSSPSQVVHVHLDDENNVVSFENVEKGEEKTSKYTRQSPFIVRRQYSWHSVTSDYRRLIAKVEHDGKFLQLAVVQYIVNTNDTSQLFKSH